MKVETPQILWNSEGDKGLNAALNSISMLESGLSDHGDDETNTTNVSRKYGNVMVTAGNTHIINLWKLSFPSVPSHATGSSSTNAAASTNANGGMFQKQSVATKIDYLCSFTRQEQSVNTVAFSPDGLHLATGGETGAIVVWSVPPSKRGGGNGRHYWSTVEREQDLNVRIVSRSGEGVCDISWSADSKRFVAGTIDHTVLICEDKNYETNHRVVVVAGAPPAVDSDWQIVYRNSMDHTHYVQGVAYDPLGVYLASMGSDRTVRVFPRKAPPKSKKKVLRPANAGGSNTECFPPPEHQRMVDQLLTESKLEVGKSKLIKFRRASVTTTTTTSSDESAAENNNNNAGETTLPKPQRSHLFADESTLESFFRRLSWTADGAYLVTPAALWHADPATSSNAAADSSSNNEKASPSFATYLFARHKFDEPYKVLTGLEKPSLVVRASPVLFKLPGSGGAPPAPTEDEESKENQTPSSSASRGLPYRSVFAVLTTDSILVYDTHHTRPLSVVRGLHYAGLSDCQWSSDGMKLVVSSIDGYVSILSFEHGELGEVYSRPSLTQNLVAGASAPSTSVQSPLQSQNRNSANVDTTTTTTKSTTMSWSKPKMELTPIPPCEPGQSATIEAPPSKRAKKTRITPTLISAPNSGSLPVPPSEPCGTTHNRAANEAPVTHAAKRRANEILEHETNTVGEAVTKLTLDNNEKPKKKKRIQPILVSAGN